MNDYSLLYVYDENAKYNFNIIPIQNLDFKNALSESFWNEEVDGVTYSVPEINNCMLNQLLTKPLNFHANLESALIIHLHNKNCKECEKTVNSIKAVIHDNENLGISWVDIEVGQSLKGVFD